jgi:hypothetical protein
MAGVRRPIAGVTPGFSRKNKLFVILSEAKNLLSWRQESRSFGRQTAAA